MRSARSPAGMLIAALLVPAAWFLALAVLYALATLVCAGIVSSPRAWHGLAATVVVATVVLIAWVIAWVALTGGRRSTDDDFARKLALLLAVLSFLATLWLSLPAAMLPACASPG
jgi:hypothetical protein